MKVITSKQTDTIDLSEVTEDMYFVGIRCKNHVHLMSREGVNCGAFQFRFINYITKGERFFIQSATIQGLITEYVNNDGEVHAFTDYKEAFKFIAENL